MSTIAPALEIRGLSCRHGRVEAVRHLDLRVAPGTVCALVGHNGAGKSTVFHTVLGMLRPWKGDALVFGRSACDLTEDDRSRIGWVADNHELPRWMTVDQYLDFLRPMYPGWDDAFCGRLKRLFALPGGRKLGDLSRGQRMKAAFLGALSYHPRLLLLDEPFGGLDPAVREDLLDAILDLTEQEDWTVLLSTHDMDEVERLADSIAVIQEGRLLFHEETAALLDRCRTVRLAWAGNIPAANFPTTWLSPQVRGGEVKFTDIDFDEQRLAFDLAKTFGGAASPHVSRATLKTVCAALIRSHTTPSAP